MAYDIYQTTAENVIAATDAALQIPEGVDERLVSAFIDTTPTYARDALQMARELSLLREPQPGQFVSDAKCGLYLCTAVRESKAAILRYVLEQYEPYRTFKARLELTGVVGEAANQTRALHSISAHRQVISNTFTDLGTYAQSLVSEGGGLYRPRQDDPKVYLEILDRVIQDRETAALEVRRRLGEEAASWIDGPNVLENLVSAYQRAAVAENDPRAPIVYAGNAVESFLSQLAAKHTVNVQYAHGINAKADALASANHLLSKHKFMVKYLGHVRNAADHGVDSEIGTQWEISQKTAVEYVYVAQSVISAIVKKDKGIYVV
ncbi:MAG TPA: hypothetical protein PKK23_17665 [Nitrospirales bacterium]|nr:hypothetical protein [Nitrospiraceae bacterium]HNP30875.1 hypothetical protein [Nitrospirales bacterium]